MTSEALSAILWLVIILGCAIAAWIGWNRP